MIFLTVNMDTQAERCKNRPTLEVQRLRTFRNKKFAGKQTTLVIF